MYIDASALFKLYVIEPDSELVAQLLDADAASATSALTVVELRRNLARRLAAANLAAARRELARDWRLLDIVEVDDAVCRRAAEIGEETLVRTLDAIHLSSAERTGGPLLTFDLHQVAAARAIGVPVVDV